MADRPYHHGHLRDTLLAEAERTLREQGIEQLSLRDLARQAGVSHAAPRRHFADRQALLDALGEAGCARLAGEVTAAIEAAGPDFPARLRAVAMAYVRFATEDTALMELMFTVKKAGSSAAPSSAQSGAPSSAQSGAPQEGSTRLFFAAGDLIRQGQQAGQLPPGDPERLRLLLIATVQGIATLVTSGRISTGQAATLIDDTVVLFTRPGGQ